jgi:hypothetical protein
MRQIASRLPEVSAAALAPVAAQLARVLPDLITTVPAPEAREAFDERMRVQRALADYFASVSDRTHGTGGRVSAHTRWSRLLPPLARGRLRHRVKME